MDPEGGVRAILSQSDILSFIAHHPQYMEPHGEQTIAELGLVTPHSASKIFGVGPEISTLEALGMIQQRRLHCVPIVDPSNGQLVGALSPSDLRGLTVEQFDLLRLPVVEFQKQLHSKSSHVVVQANTKLKDILSNLVANKAHFLFVVDESNRPIAIVTNTDLLHLWCSGH